MGSEARKILEEALALAPDERAMLARELLASIDLQDQAHGDPAWTAEITKRAERVLSGESNGVPWDTVRLEGRALLDRK